MMNETTDAGVGSLPRYRCHKEVRAAKIVDITRRRDMPSTLILEGNRSALVESSWIDKHLPASGGYYVVYADGYTSFSPAKAFEEGYSLLTPEDGKVSEEEAAAQLQKERAKIAPAFKKYCGPVPPAPSPRPSIGRIVLYNHPGSADGTYPPTQSPAIVQRVYEDGTADLWVFGPKGIHKDGPYIQGDGPCQWNWPPRV